MITNPVVFDIETSTIPDVASYSDDLLKVPARYKDPEKIAAWIEEARAKQAQFAALDMDLARIVAVCWTTDGKKLRGGTAKDEDAEQQLIARFWADTKHLTYVGFNVLDFDLPMLVRRSQYLNLEAPDLELGRYRHRGVVDIMQVLTWDGKINARSLSFYCKRFGIPAPADESTGADVPGLVAMGEWDRIRKHCAVDVLKEWRLAERLGLIDLPASFSADTNPF